ncbi:MAG: DUF4124 domain-containing protein, partial [Pseudomonadota bacterium]
MRLTVVLLWSLVFTPALAEIYKHVGEDGSVYYSDRPSEGAAPVELPPASVYTPRKLPTLEAPETPDAKVPQPLYERVAVVTPPNDGTIWDNQGRVEVAVDLEPALRPGHVLEIHLDGRPLFTGLTTSRVTLNNVDRGSHTLEV